MAKHTSIEVLKNIVVGDGIYSKTVFLENNIISSSFDEPITISASVKQSLPDNSEYTVSVFPIQPCIKYNDETLAWEFTHGLPNVWSKLNNVSYIESFPSGNNLNDGIYVDVNGQTKYFNKNNWIDMSMEITDMIFGNFDTVPTDYAVYQFGNLISGNIITYVNERFDELKKYIDSVKPRYYTEIDIEYGKSGETYTWEDNILIVNHNLNTQLPTIMCCVRKTIDDMFEQAFIPHIFIPNNLNTIKFDCERI
jgi:hypothetical protein